MTSIRNRILNRLIPGRVRRRHEYLMSTVPSYRQSITDIQERALWATRELQRLDATGTIVVDGEVWHVPDDRRAALRASLEWQSHGADNIPR